MADELKERHDTGGPNARQNDHLATATVRCEAEYEAADEEAKVVRESWRFRQRLQVAEYLELRDHSVA